MSAFLTDPQRDFIQAAIRYLVASGGAAKPVDEIISHLLAKNFSAFGFRSEIAFKDALRDDAVKTLLDALLYLDANPPVPTCAAATALVQHASDGDVGSPFPVVFVTLNDAPVNGTLVVIERAGQADFSDASTLVSIAVVSPTTQYGGEPLSQDFSAFFPGRYYYRAHVSNCSSTQSNAVFYDVI